jgi:hypothetical protein
VKEVDPAAAVGWFLGAFGVLVFAAIPFTPGTPGRVTNAACGAILLAIAAVLIRTRWGGPK